jgi:hypothetical protein
MKKKHCQIAAATYSSSSASVGIRARLWITSAITLHRIITFQNLLNELSHISSFVATAR